MEHDPAEATIAVEGSGGRFRAREADLFVANSGTSLRFLAITLRVDDENYAIAVFVSDASDPVRVLPAVEGIVASFEAA